MPSSLLVWSGTTTVALVDTIFLRSLLWPGTDENVRCGCASIPAQEGCWEGWKGRGRGHHGLRGRLEVVPHPTGSV